MATTHVETSAPRLQRRRLSERYNKTGTDQRRTVVMTVGVVIVVAAVAVIALVV